MGVIFPGGAVRRWGGKFYGSEDFSILEKSSIQRSEPGTSFLLRHARWYDAHGSVSGVGGVGGWVCAGAVRALAASGSGGAAFSNRRRLEWALGKAPLRFVAWAGGADSAGTQSDERDAVPGCAGLPQPH